MLAILGASGKLGFTTLQALLEYNLFPAQHIVVTTSSSSGKQKLAPLADKHGVVIRECNWDSEDSIVAALQGCTQLFLISSSRIWKDFNFAPPGQGREADHFTALRAARTAGVSHVYYTSLAFGAPQSKSCVMTAHLRTEAFLEQEWKDKHTVLREGLYNESWGLYFGYFFDPKGKDSGRTEVVIGGDGNISWTSVPDLGLANALILSAPIEDWAGKKVYLSQKKTVTLHEISGIVSEVINTDVRAKIVAREEHERHYVDDKGMPQPDVEWWARTYDALRANECEIDDSTLEDLLAKRGVTPKSLEETIREMCS